MSNEGLVQQEIVCLNPECKQPFVVMVPQAEVTNTMTVSLIIWAHPDVQACPHCGIAYQMAVQKLRGVEMRWGPVRTQGDTGIVAPPPGFRLPKPS